MIHKIKTSSEELFSEEFISTKTKYTSIEELLSESGFDQKELMAINNPEFDKFLQHNTNFYSLGEFRKSAALYSMRLRLGLV